MNSRTKAARHHCNDNRAKSIHGQVDSFILPDERDRAWQIGTVAAGIITMIAFGVMFCVGAWLGW